MNHREHKEHGADMNEEQLLRKLYSVGMTSFVKYFKEFSNPANTRDYLKK